MATSGALEAPSRPLVSNPGLRAHSRYYKFRRKNRVSRYPSMNLNGAIPVLLWQHGRLVRYLATPKFIDQRSGQIDRKRQVVSCIDEERPCMTDPSGRAFTHVHGTPTGKARSLGHSRGCTSRL